MGGLYLAAGLTFLVALAAAFSGEFMLVLLAQGMCYAAAVLGLEILYGHAGMLSFGHAAWFGSGAYVAALFSREVSTEVVLSITAAMVVCGLVAFLIGLVITRLHGVGFAIMTLVVAQIVYVVAVKARTVTGGLDGLGGIPLPTFFGTDLASPRVWFVVTGTAVVLFAVATYALLRTPFGRTLDAIRNNRVRAQLVGVNVRMHRAAAFGIAGALGAAGGAMVVLGRGSVSPDSLYWVLSGNFLLIAIAGGLGTLWGPLFAAIAWVVLLDSVSSSFRYWELPFGLIFVLIVLFFPAGFGGAVKGVVAWAQNRRF